MKTKAKQGFSAAKAMIVVSALAILLLSFSSTERKASTDGSYLPDKAIKGSIHGSITDVSTGDAIKAANLLLG